MLTDDKPQSKPDKDVQSRGWMMTIPAANHTVEQVRSMLTTIAPAAVFQQEKGGITGYEHFQCYVQLPSPRRWSTMKKMLADSGFDDAHFERQWATGAACYRYCTKEDTRIDGPWVIGNIQMNDKQGQRSDIAKLKKMIMDGMSYNDVLLADETGNAGRYRAMLKDLQEARNAKKLDSQGWRKIEVNYLSGASGVGKTRYIFDHYKSDEFYRITDYSNPWDRYNGQKVVVFDEFSGQPTIEEMLDWLDCYTTQLRARYNNRIGSYDEAWVISNLSLDEQYVYKPEAQRAAFRRRFTHIYTMGETGILTDLSGQADRSASTNVVRGHADTLQEAIDFFKLD